MLDPCAQPQTAAVELEGQSLHFLACIIIVCSPTLCSLAKTAGVDLLQRVVATWIWCGKMHFAVLTGVECTLRLLCVINITVVVLTAGELQCNAQLCLPLLNITNGYTAHMARAP